MNHFWPRCKDPLCRLGEVVRTPHPHNRGRGHPPIMDRDTLLKSRCIPWCPAFVSAPCCLAVGTTLTFALVARGDAGKGVLRVTREPPKQQGTTQAEHNEEREGGAAALDGRGAVGRTVLVGGGAETPPREEAKCFGRLGRGGPGAGVGGQRPRIRSASNGRTPRRQSWRRIGAQPDNGPGGGGISFPCCLEAKRPPSLQTKTQSTMDEVEMQSN